MQRFIRYIAGMVFAVAMVMLMFATIGIGLWLNMWVGIIILMAWWASFGTINATVCRLMNSPEWVAENM